MALTGQKAAPKLIDDATLDHLVIQRREDTSTVNGIHTNLHLTEFKFGHSERLNNFQVNEIDISEANLVESLFLSKVHDGAHENLFARHVIFFFFLFFFFLFKFCFVL